MSIGRYHLHIENPGGMKNAPAQQHSNNINLNSQYL